MAALDIERIPYRRPADPADPAGDVTLLTRDDLGAAVQSRFRRGPTLTIGVGGSAVHAAFGVEAPLSWSGSGEIELDERLWPAAVRERARAAGTTTLRLPSLTAWECATPPAGEVLATLRRADGRSQAAIVSHGAHVWSLVDLGAALSDLMDERYRPPVAAPERAMPRAMLATYYRAPEALRRTVQRRSYRRLVATLAKQSCPSRYPVDASGWLLVEAVVALVRRAAGALVRLHRWPAPYRSAATLTHDLEPSRFTYGPGLQRLRERVRRLGHKATYGVVARPATWLAPEAAAELRTAEVLCHGLEHRGETMLGEPQDVAAGLVRARAGVQAALGMPVSGFRSPRLDRAPALVWALDRTGFAFDSSYPDVDRENLQGYGGGVRLNVPFRAPVADGGGTVRASRCLELPVSAPDCIQPLFEGGTLRELRRAVREKIAFIRATGGVYVGIVHAGVFGPRDAARRGAHLAFVHRLLSASDVWLTSLAEIAGWWRMREQVEMAPAPGHVRLTNLGERRVVGLRCLVETGTVVTELAVPALDPGASVTLATGLGATSRAEGL